MLKKAERSLSQKGWFNKPTKLQVFHNFNMHAKYEVSFSYASKIYIANVIGFATNGFWHKLGYF